MPNLLAMSLDGNLAPAFDLRCLSPTGTPPDGWGLGYYPAGEPSASVLKEPSPQRGSLRSELVRAWDHVDSGIFLVHIRTATWGAMTDANTQPFVRPYAGRDWTFAHAGSLSKKLDLGERPRFEPVGSTDSERVFCKLLSLADAGQYGSIAEIPQDVLRGWFEELNYLGGLTLALSDGQDVLVYADRSGDRQLFLWELVPPYERASFSDADLEIRLTDRGAVARRAVVISSDPLRVDSNVVSNPETLQAGDIVVVRRGVVRHRFRRDDGVTIAPPSRSSRRMRIPGRASARTYAIRHHTSYEYEKDVGRSAHLLRLKPAHDLQQTVLSHELHISVDGETFEYEDVFGNQVRRLFLDSPYRRLVIDSQSVVRVHARDPILLSARRGRSAIPVPWMPWQRQALEPYLLPPELPETQLEELVEYAMGFVERSDRDLFDTIADINATIFREYEYSPGWTNLATTPWDVYCARKGVCQDFSNLFICLARLLSVPARYAFGYVYAGPKSKDTAYAEASHAWVEVYFPEVGWRGFDPTNGSIVETEHVRVAVGRNFLDATPTSGTIYLGGGGERLTASVSVEVASEE